MNRGENNTELFLKVVILVVISLAAMVLTVVERWWVIGYLESLR